MVKINNHNNNRSAMGSIMSGGAVLGGLIVMALVLLMLPSGSQAIRGLLPPTDKHMQAKFAQCRDEYNILDGDFDVISQEALSETLEQRFKCYLYCVLVAIDALDENGKIVLNRVKNPADLKEHELNALMQCQKETENISDPCEYSFAFIYCMRSDSDK